MSCPLTAAERYRLGELEAVISSGLDSFCRVGAALAAVRTERLYRQTHASFGAYCADRWGFSKQHGQRLIAAADVAMSVAPTGTIPANEAQARELVALDPAGRRAVWGAATAEGQPPPTAARLSDLRRRAMASLTPDEQQEVISGCEAEVIAGQESAARVGGEGRKGRLAAVGRALKKALKLAEGLGDEAEEGVNRIERARAWFAALPAE